MKLIDRQPAEGTSPAIYIGHREYRKKDGRLYVSRTWYAEWCIHAKHHQQALGTSNKNAAIRKAHDLCRRIENGEPKPKVFKINNEELVNQYLELKRNEGRSPKTLEKYTFGLHSFAKWAQETGNTSAVGFGSRLFWSFIQWLREQKKGDKTIYDRAILIKQAFKWASGEKLIPENLLSGLKIAEPVPNEQPCFTPAQVATLLLNADPHEAGILATMAYLGLRFGEVRDLRWSDILWDQGASGFVVIRRGGSTSNRTKNKKVRRIPLNPNLKPYLAAIPRAFDCVFTARPSKKHLNGGGPISERRLLLSLKRLCNRCKFTNPMQYKLHTFRHAFASMCARNNISHKYALEWMGHSSSEILDLYYTMFDEVAEAAMKTIMYATSPAQSGAA
jgi:integrase/recombinase XerD